MSERGEQASARRAVQEFAVDRLDDDQKQAAAALLVDLWAVAREHGITPEQFGWRRHLPRAAVDTIAAVGRRGPRRGRHEEPVQGGHKR